MRRGHLFTCAALACVLAVSAARAQQATFLPPPATGASLEEGAAITGAAASRLLCTDASGNLDTASPCTGAALVLTSSFSGTSAALTGQLVFNGVTTDITTGTNEDLTITPNGTGSVILGKNLSLGGTVSSTYSTACITGLATGNFCLTDDILAINSGGSSYFAARAGTTSSFAGMQLFDSATSGTAVGGLRFFDSNFAVSGLRSKIGLFATNIGAITIGESGADENSTTSVIDFVDGSGGANVNATIYGDGAYHWKTSSSIPSGDCDADAEVGRVRRYAKDANNITLCGCQKVGGTFGWAAVITGGDCTWLPSS